MSTKTRIYLAVYRTSADGYSAGVCGKAWGPLSTALKRGEWPLDVGDDPSFFSSDRKASNLTWGICRQQVRNSIRPGDICVFFSVGDSSTGAFEYRLCVVSTVEKKVRDSELWRDPTLKNFKNYLNLLVRPLGPGAWAHFAPGTEELHKDCDRAEVLVQEK